MDTVQPAATRRVPDGVLLAVLALLSVAVHGWLIGHTEVPARDTVGFIRFALALEQGPVADVLRNTHQAPLYPATVLVASWPARLLVHDTTPQLMVLVCQLVNSAAALLLVVPMFYLGRELIDRRVGFWAAALVQCLPTTARITADGLTEGLFLLLATTALLLAAIALRRGGLRRFLACGLCGGLAFLTRPEGGLVIAATGAVLLGAQLFAGWRQPWRRVLAGAACLGLGAVVTAGPYIATIGSLSNKPTTQQLIHGEGPADPQAGPAAAVSTGTLLAVWWPGSDTAPWWWSVQAVFMEVLKGFSYFALVPALAGLYWFRSLWRSSWAAWLLTALAVLQLAGLARMSHVVGYVSERHVQLLVLIGAYWAMATILALGDALAARLRHTWPALLTPALVVALGLPAVLRPMHPGYDGHLAAGRWLTEHVAARDGLFDPLGIATLYAGRWQSAAAPDRPLYIVLEDRAKPHRSMPLVGQARELADQGEPVFHWQPGEHKRGAAVTVYRLPKLRPQGVGLGKTGS